MTTWAINLKQTDDHEELYVHFAIICFGKQVQFSLDYFFSGIAYIFRESHLQSFPYMTLGGI